MAARTSPVEPRALRDVCGLFVTGVTVITSGAAGRAAGTTVNSFTSVSLDPPLVLFCLHHQSRLRPTIEESGTFAVNFLTGRQEKLAWAFSGRPATAGDDITYRRSKAGVPILNESLAFLACRLVNEFDGGDHAIYLGEVTELGVHRRQEPLIFFRGSLSALEEAPHADYPIWDG